MSEPKDRRRRLVPSVNTVKKKAPPPVVKPDTPVVLKSPRVIKDTRIEANTSKVVNPPGKAQVFVLSPAILKQMGINIGSLQQNPPNEEMDVTTKKKGRPKKPKGNSADVKKALYNKLTEKRNQNINPPQQIVENKKSFTSEPNHPIKAIELLKTFNLSPKYEFVKPASPLVCPKSGSSNMETVSYFTSSLVMSPGEDISSYLAGYKKIPKTLPLVSSSDESNTPTHSVADCHPINSSECSVPLHSAEVKESIQTSTNRHINFLPPSDELNNSLNFGSDAGLAVSGGSHPECGSEQYYEIHMYPDHEEALTEQVQFIDSEMQISSQLVNSNPNQNDINISLNDIHNMTENSLDDDDGAQDISENNDETFDYIIEDVNSDEIEKVDLMNVDFDLLNKETNEDMEHQQSYLCPEDTNADSSQVILGGSVSIPSCTSGTESERLPPFEIISPVSTIKNYLYGGIGNSTNSTNIERNIDILLSEISMNQTIQFSPQQFHNYIENNANLISVNVTKDFESSDIININKEGNLTIEPNHKPANLTVPTDISEDIKAKSININKDGNLTMDSIDEPINVSIPADISEDVKVKTVNTVSVGIESKSPKAPINHLLTHVTLDTETKFVTQVCMPFNYSPKGVIRHSSSSKQIQVCSPTADSTIVNRVQRVGKVKYYPRQHITNSGVLNIPSESIVTNKNSLTGDKQLTKINISNIYHISSGEEIHVPSPTEDSQINQLQRVKEVTNSFSKHAINSDRPSERTVTDLLLSNKNSLRVDKQVVKSSISSISHSSSSKKNHSCFPTVDSKVNQAQKPENNNTNDPQHATKSDVLNIPSEKIMTYENSLKGEKQFNKTNILNGTQGCLQQNKNAVNQESIRRNEIALISDRILEEREKMSQACQDEKSLNKIADYLKMFHQRKPVSKSDIKLNAETAESVIIKERKLCKEETGRDETMHGVEKPGGQFTIGASVEEENTELVNTIQNNILPNLKILEIISNSGSAMSENSDRINKYPIKNHKLITDTSNIDLPHNSPASTSISTNFAIEAQSGAGTGLQLPGTQSFLTYESYSQTMFKTCYKHNNGDYDLFQDTPCEVAAGVSDDIPTKNCPRTNKSTDIKQTPSDTTSPQFNEFERNYILNTSLNNIRTYSRRKNKYRNNDTKLIDLPSSSWVNVSLAENDLKMDEMNIGNVSYGLNTADEKPPTKPYILSRHSVLAQELKRDHFQLDNINKKSDKLIALEQQDDTDVFSLAIDESLKKISPPKKPLKLKIHNLEVSPSTSSDHFSSILPKKRFCRQGNFVEVPRNNCMFESSETGHTSVTSPKKKGLQISINEGELATIRPPQECLDFFEKKECNLSKKSFDTKINESHQDDKLQSIGKSTASLQTLGNNPLENPKDSSIEFMDPKFESTSNDDLVTELIEIVDDSNSQTNVHNVMSANDSSSAVFSPRSNYQVPATIINKKVISSPRELNLLLSNNTSGGYEKYIQSELNKSPPLCLENDTKISSPKINKVICRPPKKSIIERVRTDSQNDRSDCVAILFSDSQPIAPHFMSLQGELDTFSKIGCDGDTLKTSQEITDHTSVIEEKILPSIDSIDKNADINPIENINLQCSVISTHSSDEAFVETSINNSAIEKEIKSRETQRKIQGIPSKIKSVLKRESVTQRMSQIQPVEESSIESQEITDHISVIEEKILPSLDSIDKNADTIENINLQCSVISTHSSDEAFVETSINNSTIEKEIKSRETQRKIKGIPSKIKSLLKRESVTQRMSQIQPVEESSIESQEITDHISVIEEKILPSLDSIDKNADINPSENINLQCSVISTHSSDEAFVETSINNSTIEKEIKSRESQRKIKGIPSKIKSVLKEKSVTHRTSQIQPVEESSIESQEITDPISVIEEKILPSIESIDENADINPSENINLQCSVISTHSSDEAFVETSINNSAIEKEIKSRETQRKIQGIPNKIKSVLKRESVTQRMSQIQPVEESSIESQEITDHISVIEEKILPSLDSIDKNADINPIENINLQCSVISTHSSDEAFVETSINNSTIEKEIKSRESQRKIKGIPSKIKSVLKRESATERTSQIQPVEESSIEIMRDVEQINNIRNANALQSSDERNDNIYPEAHIYSTVLASNDILEKIHEAVRRESISAVDKSDSSYEDIIQIEIAEDPDEKNEADGPTLNDECIGACELSTNDIGSLDSVTQETSIYTVSQGHNDGSDIDNNDSIDGDYSTAYNSDTCRDDHDPGSMNSANTEGELNDESWNTSQDFEQSRTKISKRAIGSTIFNNVEKGNEYIQNVVPDERNSDESETISKNVKKNISTKKCKRTKKKITSEKMNEPDDDCPLSAIKNFDKSTPRRKKGRPPKQPIELAPPKKSKKSLYQRKDSVTCAVCQQKLKKSSWPLHNLNIHKYLGWLEGDEPVDLQDESVVISLVTMAKKKIELVCEKCGEKRASTLGYISHILYMCQKTEEEIEALKETCTICKRRVLPSGMKVHLLAHTRTSVKAAKPLPVELPVEDETGRRRKRKAAEKAGHTFKKLKTLQHESPLQRDIKELYKKPWFGRATGIQLSLWKRELAQGKLAACRRCKHQEDSVEAINQHYISTCPLIPERLYQCLCCRFKSETEAAMVDHIQEKHPGETVIEMEDSSTSDGEHSDDVPDPQSSSEEDEYETDSEEKLFVRPGRKRTSTASNNNQSILSRNTSALSTDEWKLPATDEIRSFLPSFHFAYRVGANLKKLYSLWDKKFVEKFYTDEGLFPKLDCNPLQALSTSEAETYFPECKESIRMANSTMTSSKNLEWRRYKLFESDLFDGTQTFWCGGPVRGLAWAPGRNRECYVAVATDRFMDSYYKEDVHYKHKGIIQIWSVGPLHDKDKGCVRPARMVMGIAHNFGQVWNLTWCPSGCEMAYIPGSHVSQDGVRLGLLAAACSDGNVHIYAVANPQSIITCESDIYTTDPVASLKLYRDDTVTLGRTQYHATQVFWSQDLGHRVIAVGYSSGIVALFDLGSTSVLLMSQHGNTTLYLPYLNFQAHRTRVTGLVLLPPVPGYSAPLMCVTSPSGCGIWSGETRTYFRRGPYTGASGAPQWPQVIAYTEDVQPSAGSASILPVRISCGHMDRITIIEPGIIGGAVTPWNGGLLGLGLQGQLSARLHRCPYIPKDRKNSKNKFTHCIWHPQIVDLSKEEEQPNDTGKLNKPQGRGFGKSGKGAAKSDHENKRETRIIELATSFEEARENYGILFVNNSKNIPIVDGVYSLSTWPMWESLCVAVPGSPERFNYCAVGGRAGHCRVSFTPEIMVPSNYCPGAYKKNKKN